MDPVEALRRTAFLLERENAEFRLKVRRGYLKAAKAEPAKSVPQPFRKQLIAAE